MEISKKVLMLAEVVSLQGSLVELINKMDQFNTQLARETSVNHGISSLSGKLKILTFNKDDKELGAGFSSVLRSVMDKE